MFLLQLAPLDRSMRNISGSVYAFSVKRTTMITFWSSAPSVMALASTNGVLYRSFHACASGNVSGVTQAVSTFFLRTR